MQGDAQQPAAMTDERAVVAEAAAWLHAAYDRPPQTPEVRAMLARVDALLAAQAQPQVPDGWQIVPKEPTEEMWTAGRDPVMYRDVRYQVPDGMKAPPWRINPATGKVELDESKGTAAVHVWRAMIAAAPPVPGHAAPSMEAPEPVAQDEGCVAHGLAHPCEQCAAESTPVAWIRPRDMAHLRSIGAHDGCPLLTSSTMGYTVPLYAHPTTAAPAGVPSDAIASVLKQASDALHESCRLIANINGPGDWTYMQADTAKGAVESLLDALAARASSPSGASQEALTADAKDAARWRQWRAGKALEVSVPNPAKPGKSITVIYGPNPEPGYGVALDAAIDAAMEQQHAQEQEGANR